LLKTKVLKAITHLGLCRRATVWKTFPVFMPFVAHRIGLPQTVGRVENPSEMHVFSLVRQLT